MKRGSKARPDMPYVPAPYDPLQTTVNLGTDAPATAMINGIDVKMYAYELALAAAVAVFGVSIWMSRLPLGFALKAIRNDEQAAEVVGIRIFPAKLKAMAFGAMAAAIAGGAYAWSFRYIDPRAVFGLDVALIPVAMALLGGSGLLWGPLIGTILLSVGIQFLIVKLTMLQFTIIGLAILLSLGLVEIPLVDQDVIRDVLT